MVLLIMLTLLIVHAYIKIYSCLFMKTYNIKRKVQFYWLCSSKITQKISAAYFYNRYKFNSYKKNCLLNLANVYSKFTQITLFINNIFKFFNSKKNLTQFWIVNYFKVVKSLFVTLLVFLYLMKLFLTLFNIY